MDGEILPHYVARTGKLPALQALAFAGQLLAALDRAHRAGYAYTGFRAHDLVVMLNGQLVLTAWSFAKRGPLRLQPAMDDDLLAAARIAFELMTARPVSSSDSAPAAGWFPPSHAGLPLALDAVFERALSPDAGQRYATAAALWQAMWSAMGPPVWERHVKPAIVLDEPKPKAKPQRAAAPQVVHTQAPARQALSRPRAKSRTIFAVAGVAAALVLAAVAGGLVSREETPAATQETTAVATPAPGVDTLLEREAPPPREEIVAGSPAALEPREPEPEPETTRDAAPSPSTRLVPATSLEAARPQTAPVTRTGRSDPPRAAQPRIEQARTERSDPPRAAQPRIEQARTEQQRTAVAARTTIRNARVAGADGNLGCTQEFLLTREWCKISKCETAEYSGHPVCKAMRAEQHRRNLVADQAMRTR